MASIDFVKEQFDNVARETFGSSWIRYSEYCDKGGWLCVCNSCIARKKSLGNLGEKLAKLDRF